MPVTPEGYIKLTDSQIRDLIKKDFNTSFRQEVDLDTLDSGFRELANVEVNSESRTESDLEQITNNLDISIAVGIWLDNIGKQIGFTRLLATASTSSIIFIGVPNTQIPQGFLVSAPTYGLAFQTLSVSKIDSTGQVLTFIQCLTMGIATNIPENTITNIVSPLSGINSCNNPSATAGGSDIETDDEYRERLISQNVDNIGSIQNLNRKLLEINGVSSVNYRLTDTLPKSVNFAIFGGTDDDIGNVFYLYSAVPFYTSGSIVVNVPNEFGRLETYYFDRPIVINIDVKVTFTTSTEPSVDFINALKGEISRYLDSIKIGDKLIRQEIAFNLGSEFSISYSEDIEKNSDIQFSIRKTDTIPFVNVIQFLFNEHPSLVNFVPEVVSG